MRGLICPYGWPGVSFYVGLRYFCPLLSVPCLAVGSVTASPAAGLWGWRGGGCLSAFVGGCGVGLCGGGGVVGRG